MASDRTISDLLQKLAAAFGKQPAWVSTMVPIWLGQFDATPDHVLAEAVLDLMGSEEWCPKPATVRKRVGEIEAKSPKLAASRSCGRCADGWRTVVRHVQRAEIEREERVAKCSCLAGKGIANGEGTQVAGLDALVSAWQNDPDTLGLWVDPRDLAETRTPATRARIAKSVGRWDVRAILRDQERDAHAGERARYAEREAEREFEHGWEGEGDDAA